MAAQFGKAGDIALPRYAPEASRPAEAMRQD
jgi:hypothetical protein